MAVQKLEPYWDKLFQRQQSSALFKADLAMCPGQDWPHATLLSVIPPQRQSCLYLGTTTKKGAAVR